jgi:hypothetical protein
MWKVKRMNTARIVVLTIAVGAGGIAACPARGSDDKPLPAGAMVQGKTVDVPGATSDIGLLRLVANGPARRAIADLNAVETGSDQGPRRGAGINPVRYAAASSATQK